MDPIRTAVKYSLIPLRTVVQLGELFVESGEQAPPPREREREEAQPPRRRPAAQKRAQPRRKTAGPQASQTPKALDDVSLARKVETVIFRDQSVPKGKIDVNAADGVVWLRGEAKTPEMIKSLEREATGIPEVNRVENLLHLPKTPARRPAPARQERERKVETGTTNEGLTAHGEDSPVEAAHQGKGRQPAPLGSNGSGS